MAARAHGWTVRLLALALVVSGCGGGDGDEQPSGAASQAASAAPVAAASASAEPASAGEKTYKVESGDTLSAIAKQFDTTVEAIVDANDISNPDVLDVGDKLVIPTSE